MILTLLIALILYAGCITLWLCYTLADLAAALAEARRMRGLAEAWRVQAETNQTRWAEEKVLCRRERVRAEAAERRLREQSTGMWAGRSVGPN